MVNNIRIITKAFKVVGGYKSAYNCYLLASYMQFNHSNLSVLIECFKILIILSPLPEYL